VRFFKKGAPPTPQLAIEEAKKTREVLAEEMHTLMPGGASPEEIRRVARGHTRSEHRVLAQATFKGKGFAQLLTNWRRQLADNPQERHRLAPLWPAFVDRAAA